MSRYHRDRLIAPSLAALSVIISWIPGRAAAQEGTSSLPTTAPPPPPLNWQPCADLPNRDCATLTVPLDYANLGKGFIDLPVMRARATGSSLGMLVFNPGGPGQPATGWIADVEFLFSPEVVSRFDVVGFDPRGTRDRITCFDPGQQELYWETNHLPRTNAEITNLMGLERDINMNCRDNNQPLVSHADTASTVRDLEQLRRAAGVQTFSYVGYSYGTFIGYRYARLYPGRLRAAVLDAVSDRSVSDQQHIKESNLAFDAMWQDFKSWCQANTSCHLHGENIEAVTDQLLAQARVNPVPAPRGPWTQRPVNDWLLTFAIQVASSFGDITFNWVDQVISEARVGDASLARFIYDISTGVQETGGYFPDFSQRRAITCIDTKWSRILKTIPDVKAFAADLRHDSPRLGESNAYQTTNCFGYPITPVEPPPLSVSVSGQPAILLVGATKDASTPLVWAARMASKLSGSRLLVRNGYGHVSYDKSRCIQQHVDRFLVDLVRPSSGTVCPTDPDLYPPQDPLLPPILP